MMAFVQVLVQAASSAVVVSFNDRKPGLSMAISLVFWSVMALLAYVGLARPAEEDAVQSLRQPVAWAPPDSRR